MRYAIPVFFQTITQGEYDPKTGDYKEDTVEEEERLASVNDMGTDMQRFFYGGVRRGSLTVRLLTQYEGEADRIRIGDKVYQIDGERRLSTKHVLYVSEVI